MVSVGIIGLPNSGKSTLFNALVGMPQARVAEHPFTTIDKNVGVVNVPDDWLATLAAREGIEKVTPATITVRFFKSERVSHVMVLSKNFFYYPMLETGLTTAFWMWFGFVMSVQMTSQIFGEKNWKLFGIDTGYQLVLILAMGLVIGLF